MRAENPREIAAEILFKREKGRFVETILEDMLRARPLKPEDRRFLQELVYGAVRWQLTLDTLINQKTGGKPQKPLVQNLLRLALYQMFWLERVPSYAAVNETVEICKRRGLNPQAKFINAVLRAFSRESDATRQTIADFRNTNLPLGYSHPEWLCRRWEERFGREAAIALLEWNNSPPPTFARLNALKTSPDLLLKQWREEGVEVNGQSFDWIPPATIYELLSHPPLGRLPSFNEGLFYIQDPSTLLAVETLDPQPGEAILDLCSAPGGKTAYIAQRLQNRGRILAQDLDPARLKMVTANAARLGAVAVTVDEASFPKDTSFDRVLVDAPCSNTGVMRRRVDLRWRVSPEEIQRLALTQLQILKSAARRVRIGGVLVYSTCSIEREENQAVVREFLTSNPRFKLDHERELLPMRDRVDGAYCARLVHHS